MEAAKKIFRKPIGKILFFGLLFLTHLSTFAQEKVPQESTSNVFSNLIFILLLCIAILLLIIIIALSNVLTAAAQYKVTEQKKDKQATTGFVIKTLLLFFILGGISQTAIAQETVSVSQEQTSFGGLDAFTFRMMLSIIFFEAIIAYILHSISMQMLGREEYKRKLAEERAKQTIKRPSFIEKINASVAVEEEADIMLNHNYDGIRELDNNLPPWWKYGFYVTIIWAVVYLFHYHVADTGKLQQAEYEDQLAQAKVEMEEYRKKAANLVDENNAIALVDEASLSSGKIIYMENCAACHGRAGEGGVGPNLTDDYWLHNGGIKDIFKTIKYGWPEKGMKAWQQDLGAKQIHEVSSFILSLKGSNPPNAKEKQGIFFQTESDSVKISIVDSTQIAIK